MIKRISKKVTHQGIGGKEFIIDEQITSTLTNDELIRQFNNGNLACFNFVERRPDFSYAFPHKLYYVKVNNLGYIIAEDEIETEVEPTDIKIPDGSGIDLGGGTGAAGAMAAVMPNLNQELKLDPININDEIIKSINKSINGNMMSGGMR